MKHNAKVLGLLAEMMVLTLALAGCQANPPAVVGPHVNVDVDGAWGIPEQGTDKQGANCDRWATGPGGTASGGLSGASVLVDSGAQRLIFTSTCSDSYMNGRLAPMEEPMKIISSFAPSLILVCSVACPTQKFELV
jgi:hypothetical protein